MRHILAGFRATSTLLIALLITTTISLEAQDWPSFRGADAQSIADDDPRLPLTWSTTENVVWKTPIDGLGWSSPVVWGNRIFVTAVVSDGESQEPRMGLYFPFGSPQTTDDGRFPDPGPGDLMEREADVHHWLVFALDFETGQVVWTKEVNTGAPQFDRHLKKHVCLLHSGDRR